MKRFSFALLSAVLILSVFSSCSAGSLILPADSLLSPPLYYEEYEDLVDSFNKNIDDEITLSSPKKGEYRSAIVVEDVDSDGHQEAIVFYKKKSDVSVARMHYFDFISERWVSFGDFNGYGSGIENVEITDMDLDGKKEIVVVWNTSGSSSGNILTVYRLDTVSNKFKEILNESCFVSHVIDIDSNGNKDVFLIGQANVQNGLQKVAKAMRISGDSFALFGEAKLDSNISSYSSLKAEKSSKDSPMRLYIDAVKGERQMITEVVYWDSENSVLRAPLLDSETLTNSSTLRYEPIGCSDINNDGIIDIPVQINIFGKPDNSYAADSEKIYLTEWKNLSSSGFETVAYSLVNYYDGYMINLDEYELSSLGLRNYRSQNCWVIYSSDKNGTPSNELYSVYNIPLQKWKTENYEAYFPVLEFEDNVICAFITSDGKRLGLDEEYVKSQIIRIP